MHAKETLHLHMTIGWHLQFCIVIIHCTKESAQREHKRESMERHRWRHAHVGADGTGGRSGAQEAVRDCRLARAGGADEIQKC